MEPIHNNAHLCNKKKGEIIVCGGECLHHFFYFIISVNVKSVHDITLRSVKKQSFPNISRTQQGSIARFTMVPLATGRIAAVAAVLLALWSACWAVSSSDPPAAYVAPGSHWGFRYGPLVGTTMFQSQYKWYRLGGTFVGLMTWERGGIKKKRDIFF